MDEQRIFVGRQAELNRFREILEDPCGQAIVVAGQAGMGKTWLIDRMVELATQHPSLKCGWVRYEVTPTESPDSTMALMMDNAFEAAQTCEGSFDRTDRRRAQWTALLKAFIPKGRELAELLASLRRDPQKHTREQFLERLRLISGHMSPEGRALFVVDPEKYMCRDCADSWRLVMRELPEKVKFLFAQRPEDELIGSNSFMALENVVRIPPEPLGVLAAEEVDDLVRLRADEVGQPTLTLQDAVNRYQGHPYAIQAALEIVKETRRIEDLPQDPTNEEIAATQWQQICRSGADAIRLFETYAILEVAAPHDTVQAISGLDTLVLKRLLSDPYLRALLREEEQGQRIYHAILADHVRGQIGRTQQQVLHTKAALVYRTSLEEAEVQHRSPDALAAVRLPEHVLAAEGPKAFVEAFVNECTDPLLNLGLLDAAMSLSRRSLDLVEKGTQEEAAVLGNLGLIYQTYGNLDEAEKMHKKAMEIDQRLGLLEDIAGRYGNLGLIYRTRGDLDQAEKMHSEALEINLKLRRLEGAANEYGNLGLIYQTRGDLDQAEKMQKNSLECEQKLGRLEGMAITYGNLGLIYRIRDDLDEAEKMHNKALEIHLKLGRLGGMATEYANLGVIHHIRGDLDQAERMHDKALEINLKLGRLEGVASEHGNLGLIYQTRGDLDRAEGMLKKALEIDQKLGRLEGMAAWYGGLGLIYQTHGDLDQAEEMHKKSLEISQKLGYPEGIASQCANLGLIYRTRGDLTRARASWEEALALFQKIGAKDNIRTVQALIVGLPRDAE